MYVCVYIYIYIYVVGRVRVTRENHVTLALGEKDLKDLCIPPLMICLRGVCIFGIPDSSRCVRDARRRLAASPPNKTLRIPARDYPFLSSCDFHLSFLFFYAHQRLFKSPGLSVSQFFFSIFYSNKTGIDDKVWKTTSSLSVRR